MSACSPITYSPVEPDSLEKLKAGLGEIGITVAGSEEGTIKGMGVQAEFRFSEVEKTLWIQVTEKPFFIGCDFIHKRISKAVGLPGES